MLLIKNTSILTAFPSGALFVLVSMLFVMAAFFSKETGITTLGSMLALDFLIYSPKSGRVRYFRLLLLVGTLLLLLWIRIGVTSGWGLSNRTAAGKHNEWVDNFPGRGVLERLFGPAFFVKGFRKLDNPLPFIPGVLNRRMTVLFT